MEIKLTIASLSLALVAMATPNQQGQILCASIIGAALGGYMGSFYFPGKTAHGQLTFKKRWAANLATGSCFAPMATVHLAPRFPEMPPIFLALAAGGIIGGAGVLLLTIMVPFLINLCKAALNLRYAPPPSRPPTKD